VVEINLAAARIMRACVDDAIAADGRPRWVAGSLGPTNKTLSLSPRVSDPGFREVTFDEVKGIYREQIDALLDGGVDFILIETVFDTLNAKAAAFAAAEAGDARGVDVPVMLSMTLTDLSGRNLSGQTVEAFWHSIRHVKPVAVGLNCSFGATELRPHVQALARIADTLIITYPNAGLPNDMGAYDEQPETTGGLIGGWAREGLINIVGGCCGTTPDHIAAMAHAVAGLPPRSLPVPEPALRLAGIEAHKFAA
jgi:5-methyltetrahydrofolate--homocysteine methyltransferase